MAEAGFNDVKDPNRNFLNSLVRNGIVVLICVLGIGISLWFFRQDYNKTSQRLDKKPVGTVSWVDNTVKRLSVNRLLWDRLQRNSPVYNGDVIISGVFSEAKINFNNGETLELSENTSVRIIYQDLNTSRFVLREGEIQVETGRNPFTVSLAESAAVGTANSDFRINLTGGTSAGIKSLNGFFIKVYQGAGTFPSRGGSRAIAAGEVLKLGKDGVVQPAPPLIMLTPRNDAKFLQTSNGKVPIEFQWRRQTPDSQIEENDIRLEISQARDFSLPEGSWDLENTDPADPGSLKVDLSGGTWYWRILASSVQEEVDRGRLDIVYTQKPMALLPADGSVETIPPGQDVRFSWAVPEEAETVVLEVANNPEMKNPQLQRTIKSIKGGRGSYSSSELKAGQWFWRVQPVFSDIVSFDYLPQVNSFTLVVSAELSRKSENSAPAARSGNALRLIFPPDNYSLEANRTPDILFTWENTTSPNSRFQIAERSDFSSSIIDNEKAISSGERSPFLKPGTYYWRIIGADPRNTTPPNRLVVMPALQGPRLSSPLENERVRIQEGVPTRFSWEPMNYADYYQFSLFLEGRELPLSEISSLQNNSVNVYFDPNTTGQFNWTIQGFTSPTGVSTGRIGLISRGQFSISPDRVSERMDQVSWTIPRIANLQSFAGDVSAPITLVSPRLGINIPGIQAWRSPPQALWTSVALLRNTQLIISRTADPLTDPMAIVKDASGNSAAFPSLGDGIWYWIIRGDTSELRGATPGEPFWFNVLPIPSLSAPMPIQPLDRAIGIEQLTRDRNITFRWGRVDEANAYIFSLYHNGDPPRLIVSGSPQTTNSYVLEDLSLLNEGEYLWQVEAVFLNVNGVIEQRGRTDQNAFSIEIQRSDSLRTQSQGTLYGQ